jgi:hypothetical protein
MNALSLVEVPDGFLFQFHSKERRTRTEGDFHVYLTASRPEI